MANAIPAAPLSPAREISNFWFVGLLKGSINPKTDKGLAISVINIIIIAAIGRFCKNFKGSDNKPKMKKSPICIKLEKPSKKKIESLLPLNCWFPTYIPKI